MRHGTVGLATGVNLFASVAGLLGTRGPGSVRTIVRLGTTESNWPWLLWPACQKGLASLVCKYTKNSSTCETLARFTGEFRTLRVPGQLLFALGLISDARQIGEAIGRSFKSRTLRPAAAQATRSFTSWSAVWAGAELFGTGGALLGIATGPGAAVTSGVGALIGGYVGLVASDWVARRIEVPN